jgi:hypothetical protein
MGGVVKWTVSGATQTTGADASGRYQKGWEVAYTLDSGHAGVVFVPGEVPNEATVKAAVAQAAQSLHRVVNLTSGS